MQIIRDCPECGKNFVCEEIPSNSTAEEPYGSGNFVPTPLIKVFRFPRHYNCSIGRSVK